MAIPGLNKEVLDKAIRVLGLQSAVERLPVDLAPTIQPTLDLNPAPISNVVKNINVSATATSTILTTESRKRDFYLTNVWLSSGGSDSYVTIVVNGESIVLARTKTSSNFIDMCLRYPIKIDRGTNITVTAGSATTNCSVIGYEVDSL